MSIATAHQTLLAKHAQPPEGMHFYASLEEIAADPEISAYVHLLTRAWEDFQLAGVVCVAGIPTLYLRFFSERLAPEEAAEYQRQFWNQGVATILVLVDPQQVYLYSGLAKPVKPGGDQNYDTNLIKTLSLADYSIRIHEFYHQLATGQYYRQYPDKFDAKQTVDAYLLGNLAALCDDITVDSEGLGKPEAHAFLARVLFTCYLIDRGIIDLANYKYCACSAGAKLVDVLEPLKGKEEAAKKLLYRLFDDLKGKFNGSMFDQSTEVERARIRDRHIERLVDFLRGHPVKSRQLSLGFWAYDFRWIPVETISAIYEEFLAGEDQEGKHQAGAFYTPRFLAETVIDVAVQGDAAWETKRYLDPACGSGIFLVALFNRLATRWLVNNHGCAYEEKAEALLGIMRDQLCGIDINPTACRISCFSLYLAFLDRFDPPDIVGYVERTGRKLPRILLADDGATPKPDFPVIRRDDFLDPSRPLPGRFGYVVGNPPWQGRGSKQIAQDFAQGIPPYLEPQGRACILLPSKILFNRTANKFQYQWLSTVTLEKVVQLADYSFILFKNALCPSIIARFTAAPPEIATHLVDYETPKVRKIDFRNGIIPVAPGDRKHIALRELLHDARADKVSIIWKRHLWGTPRDIVFIRHLLEMPALCEIAGPPKENKRWMKGQGFQPDPRGNSKSPKSPWWNQSDLFIKAGGNIPSLFLLADDCEAVGNRFPKLYFTRDQKIFSPPLVLISQGIGKGDLPKIVYCDFPVLFQAALQSITGPTEDENLLLFLALYLRSKLARYFLFHTSANWGTERDKVLFEELLRVPLPLPGTEEAPSDAAEIVRVVAEKARAVKEKIEEEARNTRATGDFRLTGEHREALAARRQKMVDGLQAEVESLIYRYFDLTEQEIILIDDTVEIFIKSATPHSLESRTPAQEFIYQNNLPVYQAGLSPYAETIADTLNDWAARIPGSVRVTPFGVVDKSRGLAMVRLELTADPQPFKEENLSAGLAEALEQLQRTARQAAGRLDYLRGVIWFDELSIRIIKPATVEYWTRTAALNDAAEIYARIAKARQTERRG